MNKWKTEKRLASQRLLDRFVIFFIDEALNPIILWCFGWKPKRVGGFRMWKEPNGENCWAQDVAIFICENGLEI